MNYLTLTPTADSWPVGLRKLALTRYIDGKERGRLLVASGQAWAQNFRAAVEAREGSFEPIPEGQYLIDPVEWGSGRRGDYATPFSTPGIGPVWVRLPKAPGTISARGDFGFHLDYNRETSPGSAGCPVAPDLPTLQTLVSWLEAPPESRPERLFVDYGLRTVRLPAPGGSPLPPGQMVEDQLERLHLYAHHDKLGIKHKRGRGDGAAVTATQIEIYAHDGQVGVKLNGQVVDVEALTVELAYRR